MALIVEDGSGRTDSESYASVADADDYFEKYRDSAKVEKWRQANVTRKERALRNATQYIDALMRTRWKGTRTHKDQALSHPRWGVIDSDGYGVDSDVIHTRLKEALYEAALRDFTEADGLLPDVLSGGIRRERKRLDTLEIETEYVGAKYEIKRFPLIEGLLIDLVFPPGRIWLA